MAQSRPEGEGSSERPDLLPFPEIVTGFQQLPGQYWGLQKN